MYKLIKGNYYPLAAAPIQGSYFIKSGFKGSAKRPHHINLQSKILQYTILGANQISKQFDINALSKR